MFRASCDSGRTLSISWKCSSVTATAQPTLLQGSGFNPEESREKGMDSFNRQCLKRKSQDLFNGFTISLSRPNLKFYNSLLFSILWLTPFKCPVLFWVIGFCLSSPNCQRLKKMWAMPHTVFLFRRRLWGSEMLNDLFSYTFIRNLKCPACSFLPCSENETLVCSASFSWQQTRFSENNKHTSNPPAW